MNAINKFYTKTMTKALRILAPNFAKKIARKTLFSPKSTETNWPNHVQQFNTKTKFGNIKTYRYGEGEDKCIWLVHGWSGSAFDFWPLMQKLEEKGYSTITFDFPAHGNSKGTFSSLPQMIKIFDEMANSFFEPSLVITHGMGASTIANSKWLNKYKSDILLISPILDTLELLQELVQRSGFDQELFEQAIYELNNREKVILSNLKAIPAFERFNGELKVIHDREDALAPLTMSEQLSTSTDATLITTNKLGHKKILRSKRVINTN